MSFELDDRCVRAGGELRGRTLGEAPQRLRLRGEATAFRKAASDGPDAPRGGWLSQSEVLHWAEQRLDAGTREFRFAVPEDSLPTVLGQRMRVAYYLESCEESVTANPSAVEVIVSPPAAAEGGEWRAPLQWLDVEAEERTPGEASQPAGAPEETATSWLERFLGGQNRMDRILERAIRGKLIEPEVLMAMQATMYGYSRTLVQLPRGGTAEVRPDLEAGVCVVLDREVYAPGQSMRLRLELPEGLEPAQLRARLVQRERSRCQGIESVLDTVVVEALEAKAAELELPLAASLAPSVSGGSVGLDYLLTVLVETAEAVPMQACVPVRIAGPGAPVR